jgi:Histidine kinase-, DNA gyrase B-, and HSP90-like ATPase
MAQRIPIQLHVANALQWLGTLYRSPTDALKEHVSNAIDEHVKARLDGTAHDRCHVTFTVDRRHVVVEYPYGMSRAEFESALQRVANSAKRAGTVRTVGRLGIGIFSFQQIGRRCTFYSRKTMAGETLRVVLKEGSDEASVETAPARESLHQPGLRVVISELKLDPTRPRGPLAADVLRRYLADKFDAYLREGWLSIEIGTGVGRFPVTPARITLPRLLAVLRDLPLARDPLKRVRLDVYFDPSGRGRVAIRHQGVTIVDSLAAIGAYGLEDSPWAQGFVRGVLDADFLTPLPARSGFDENDDWIGLLDLLDRYLPTLEAELEGHLAAHRARQASEIGERALRLARDILDLDEFRDLALPGGLAKRGRPEPPVRQTRSNRSRRSRAAEPAVAPGDTRSPRGRRIKYEEVPFEAGSTAHSRFVQGVVQANTLHPDFLDAARSTDSRLAYAALMIGKESIAYNDRTGTAGEFLEKLLDFYFKLQSRKAKRAGWRRTPQHDQDRLELSH